MHAAYIPDIFRDTANLLFHKDNIDHRSVLTRLEILQEKYQDWYSLWQSQLESALMEMSTFQLCETTRPQVELFCCYFQHFCIIQRLLTCLDPASGFELEKGATESARRLLAIYEQYVKSGQPKYRMKISVFVARTILTTTDRWRLAISRSCTSSTIGPRIFLEWCETWRRSVG